MIINSELSPHDILQPELIMPRHKDAKCSDYYFKRFNDFDTSMRVWTGQ